MTFRTYNKEGQKLLDSDEAVFSFVKSGRLTRVINYTYESTRKEWTTSRWLGTGTKHWESFTKTREYCMYYIDLPNAISPIAGVYYEGLGSQCNPVVYLNTGYFNSMARMMFYSNGRLSDSELAKFQIYIFDINVIKETQVGINLYDSQGNITFSSRSKPMSLQTKTTVQSIPDNIRLLSSDEAKIFNSYITHADDYDVDYYHNKTRDDGAMIDKRKNYGLSPSELLPVVTNRRCVGILSSKLSIKYYPHNRLEIEDAIGTYDIYYPPIYSAGDVYPTLRESIVLSCIGCNDGNHIKIVPPFEEINQDSSKLTTKEHLTTRKLLLDSGVVSIYFSEIDNLPFPYN